ncbi:formate/nitrite transporter family protein [Halosegnis longus]|uniref:Formate/nitrite transporter family protein n=1 Tax=Halosegnis longus TaxID=2216012 RepID=A0AAJ4R8Z3_9EURY|nr:formate/nitrite transporter family protein [Halosegnis longus]RNJ26549.1 formate/nitrite transporter family protein [Salella cibi]
MSDDTEQSETDGETVRTAIERSRSGAPAVGHTVRDRFETHEVFQRIVVAADEEATTGARELFFSALAAGFAITVTYLLYASMTAATGGAPIASVLLYPLGFVFIILGGYQLYTENTLPPVVLLLERLISVPRLLSIWGIVLLGNFTGGLAGALVLSQTGVFSSESAAAATDLARKGIEATPVTLFFKAAFAGLIVAGIVWLVYAVRDDVARVLVIYLAFLAVPLGDLFHVVVSFTEGMYLVFNGTVGLAPALGGFVVPVLLGNTVGGVVLVTVVNYFQTTEERLDIARADGVDRRLTTKELFVGERAGRSYVPQQDDD